MVVLRYYNMTISFYLKKNELNIKKIKKSGEANKGNEKINKAEELFYFYQTKYQNDNRLVDEYMDYTGETFNKFKLKIKLLDKKYEVTFKRCEAIRDDFPLAFDAKWK